MNRFKRICAGVIIGILLSGCGKVNKNEVYGPTIGGLGDEELFALVETNAKLPVLLVADEVFFDNLANQAAVSCEVYYAVDGEVKKIGIVESFGRAKPISYDKSGLYAGSDQGIKRFGINEKEGSLKLEEAASEDYEKATVVNFGYGASGR